MFASYDAAAARLGSRSSLKLEGNTYLQRRNAHSVALRLHATDIAIWYSPEHPDARLRGLVQLDMGGWHTATTKKRLNTYTSAYITQKDFKWYERGTPFKDGMLIDAAYGSRSAVA